tara:strand:+ start:755 stop:3901 length:3147 start_codon:yes stop_codon:yes gene_type:complete
MSGVSILEIDKLILSAKNINSSEQFLNKLASLVIPFLNNKEKREVNNRELFNNDLIQKEKRFISYCLLRVFSINSSLVTEGLVKHKVIKLIEDATPEVYKYLRIDSKIETYKKESQLSSYVSSIENKINEGLNKEFDLLSINGYKNSILATINHKVYKPLFNDYIDFNTINKSLDILFSVLIEYVDGEPLNKYKNYKSILKILDKTLDSSNEIGTTYSKSFVFIPFDRIKNVLIKDFATNPNSKPADLEILKTEKKYPIAEDVKHKLQLRINNNSTGFANGTQVIITDVTNVKLNSNSNFVGQIKTYSLINFDYTGIEKADTIKIKGYVEWSNFDGKKVKSDFDLQLEGQNTDVNWAEIEDTEPYDLEPVTNEEEFIGRKKIIDALKRIGKKVNSSYIFGQRRVGKTSIVKTIQSSIKFDNTLIIYLEAGDWNNATSPEKSMNDLGLKICKKIVKSNIKYKNLQMPSFNGSFNSITDFLDEVTEIDPNYQILIILDEFDRITNSLLYQGEIAQSFVLTIRSISNRPQFGFVLVGGEKLEYILSQWQEFNKFKPIRVDYFDKKSEWEDFNNLIKKPVENVLEITDKAIDYIYKQTSGNPYFTKKICIELFLLMVSNRDNHATEEEARSATYIARDSQNIGATDFSHFWKDGIKEKEAKEEEISINRRKVLLALGQLIKQDVKTTKQAVLDKSMANGLNILEAEKTLEEFVQRKIIKVNAGEYKFVVKFFEDWLVSNGLNKIITTFKEEQSIILRKQYEDDLKITSQEINKLSQSWPSYKGVKLTNENIRTWLEQFADLEEQRLMFNIIENVKFYKPNEIRDKMVELFNEVRKEIGKSGKIVYKAEGKQKRDDVLVSYLDKNPVKSGAEYAKIFVDTNNIYKDNSTNPDKIENKLKELKNINALVFIDDFIGSGDSIKENLEPILNNNKEFLLENKINIIIGVITGFEEAKHKIHNYAKKTGLNIKVILLDPLNKADKCFDNGSLIFPKHIERQKAKTICNKIGVTLEKRHPLGYGDCQSRVVFPTTCPNNSLPILWKETTNWKPLFKRG